MPSSRRDFCKTTTLQLLAGTTPLLAAGTAAAAEAARGKPVVINPYRHVDWSNARRYKSCLHAHTKLHKRENDGTVIPYGEDGYHQSAGDVYGSDGYYMPDTVIDRYREYGYDILALTDHNPFYGYGELQESYGKRTTQPWTLWNRDPDELGMVAIEGRELTNPQDIEHDISLFCDLGDIDQRDGYDRVARLKAVSDRMGLMILAHPRQHLTPRDVADHAAAHNVSIAIEVFTRSAKKGTRGALDYWDQILTETMPLTPVWGVSSDDMHTFDQLGKNWCWHLLRELRPGAVRHSLVRGEFFFCVDVQGNDVTRHHPEQVPIMTRIDVEASRIALECENAVKVNWISDGRIVATGNSLDVAEVDVGNYVRAEAIGPNEEMTGTQPFGIVHPA